ncbi:MAG: nitroreductase family protein [Rikenellaceae bacterium]
MEFKELLSTRRSIRKYSDKQVEQSVIDNLVAATLSAPSSRNSHSTHLLVVRNREIIEQMSQMRDYGSAFIKGAPVVILIMGDTEVTDLWQVNCSISATTMLMAATDLGLASCWVHVEGRPHLKDEPEGKSADDIIRSLVDIPSTFGILCCVAVGYSDFTPADLPPFDAATHVRVVE